VSAATQTTRQTSRAYGGYQDTITRDYADKLAAFNNFAAPELRQAITDLGMQPGARWLDIGCGVGLLTHMLADAVGLSGYVAGIDVSLPHCRRAAAGGAHVALANGMQLPFSAHAFDGVWMSNTLNHMHEPVAFLHNVARWLKPGGQIAIGQSVFLPDMLFAWDARLERVADIACRKHYAQRYGLDEAALSAPRNWVGLLRACGFAHVGAHTYMIERVGPLDADDQAFFAGWFSGYWGERIRPHVTNADWDAIQALTDPASAGFAPRRDDFHYLQTYTVVQALTPMVMPV
jgi:SAM-dependent methyltransferase